MVVAAQPAYLPVRHELQICQQVDQVDIPVTSAAWSCGLSVQGSFVCGQPSSGAAGPAPGLGHRCSLCQACMAAPVPAPILWYGLPPPNSPSPTPTPGSSTTSGSAINIPGITVSGPVEIGGITVDGVPQPDIGARGAGACQTRRMAVGVMCHILHPPRSPLKWGINRLCLAPPCQMQVAAKALPTARQTMRMSGCSDRHNGLSSSGKWDHQPDHHWCPCPHGCPEQRCGLQWRLHCCGVVHRGPGRFGVNSPHPHPYPSPSRI